MTATNQLTNYTLAEAADSALWDDWGSGGGSGQDDNAPVEGLENRSRRIDNGVKGFACGKGPVNLSPAGTHFGIWVRTFQPGLTNNLGLRLGSAAGGANNSPNSQWNFPGSSYPVEGPWLRLWVDPSATRDSGTGTLDLTSIEWIGNEFDMGNVGGTSDNCHIDRIDYGTVGIEISGAAGTFAQAETLDNTNVLGVLRDGKLLAPIRLKNGTFNDANFVISAGDQPLAASDWRRIEIDNTDPGNSVTWGNYFLDGVLITIIDDQTGDTLDLGTGTMLNAPAMTWSESVVFAGAIVSGGVLTVNGSDLAGARFAEATDVSAILWNDNANPGTATGRLAGTEYTSGGAGHAIEFGTTTPLDITLTDMTFTGYAGSDGSTGNEAIWIRRSSGTVNITLDGTTQPSVRTDGAIINFITGQTQVTLTGLFTGTRVKVYRISDNAEMGGVESSGTSFSVNLDSGVPVTFRLINLSRIPLEFDLTVPSTNTTIPVSQSEDRVYENL